MFTTTTAQTVTADRPVPRAGALLAPATEFAGAALARFLELRGRRIVQGCGALWYSAPNGFLMPLPYHVSLEPGREELAEMLVQSGLTGARFCSSSWGGVPGGYYIVRRGRYDLQSVHIKHRPRVKRGSGIFSVRPVEEDELIQQAVELNRETMQRQGRHDAEFSEQEPWTRFVKAMRQCPEIGAMGAFRGSRLSAFVITCREDGWLHILHQMSRKEDLADFPNHALTYDLTCKATADPEMEGVCYGLVPLVEIDGLHEYKLRFGYEAVNANCAVVLNPRMDRWLNNGLARFGAKMARAVLPRNQRLEQVQTILHGAQLSYPGGGSNRT